MHMIYLHGCQLFYGLAVTRHRQRLRLHATAARSHGLLCDHRSRVPRLCSGDQCAGDTAVSSQSWLLQGSATCQASMQVISIRA